VLAAFADSLHRIQDTVREINLVDACLASCTEFAEGAYRVWIAFHFHQAAILDVADGGVTGYALPAGSRYGLELLAGFG
jgi:hypothetical protein